MVESFLIAWRALVRGHVLTALLVLAGLAHVFMPYVVRSDGTDAGGREMFLRMVPGGVYAILCIAMLSCACSLLANERESNRLGLSVVRPASAFAMVLGRLLALVAVSAVVLAFNAGLTCARGGWRDCRHVYEPVLEPPESAALKVMEQMLADTNTPQEVRSTPRSTLLSILAGREKDRYETVPPAYSVSWPFAAEAAEAATGLVVRIRFSTQYNTRADVRGGVSFGPWSAAVSNCTQSVFDLPLVRNGAWTAEEALVPLAFSNSGTESMMLRPRCDIQLLVPADSFAMNVFRASCEMLCVVAFLCAFGLFLSAALSRPVAIFVALALLLVSEMAPAVVAQYPDAIDLPFTDRFGLALSRCVAFVTSALSGPQPLSSLATDTCLEWTALARTFLLDAVAAPLAFVSLAAVLVRRQAVASQG